MQTARDLLKAEADRCAEMEGMLKEERDQSQMKRIIMAMVDTRLGALEASSRAASRPKCKLGKLAGIAFESKHTTTKRDAESEGRSGPPYHRVCEISGVNCIAAFNKRSFREKNGNILRSQIRQRRLSCLSAVSLPN